MSMRECEKRKVKRLEMVVICEVKARSRFLGNRWSRFIHARVMRPYIQGMALNPER